MASDCACTSGTPETEAVLAQTSFKDYVGEGRRGGRAGGRRATFLARISVKIQSDAAQRVQDLPGRL